MTRRARASSRRSPRCRNIIRPAVRSRSCPSMRPLRAPAPAVAAYVPADIPSHGLSQEAARLRRDYPRLAVLPVAADFTQAFQLPRSLAGLGRTGFFPGSTIGNFEPHQAAAFLRNAAGILAPDAILIVGI